MENNCLESNQENLKISNEKGFDSIQIENIRKLYHQYGWTINEIVKTLRFDRKNICNLLLIEDKNIKNYNKKINKKPVRKEINQEDIKNIKKLYQLGWTIDEIFKALNIEKKLIENTIKELK